MVAQYQELQELLDVHNEAAKHILDFIQSDEFHHKFNRDQNDV